MSRKHSHGGETMPKETLPMVNAILTGVEFIAKNKPELTLEYIRCIREPLNDRRAQNGENKKKEPAHTSEK